jgi:hypothetical protein
MSVLFELAQIIISLIQSDQYLFTIFSIHGYFRLSAPAVLKAGCQTAFLQFTSCPAPDVFLGRRGGGQANNTLPLQPWPPPLSPSPRLSMIASSGNVSIPSRPLSLCPALVRISAWLMCRFRALAIDPRGLGFCHGWNSARSLWTRSQ